MEIRKSIAYAYPTSDRARELGNAGYYVEQYHRNEDGNWSTPYVAQGCHDVFDSPNDADLLALFNEADGEICPYFARHSAVLIPTNH